MSHFFSKIKEAFWLWYDKDADHVAASVSYYSIFGLVPFILLTYFLTGWILGREVLIQKMMQLGDVLDDEVIDILATAINNLEAITANFSFPVIGVVFFSGMVVVMLNTFTSGLMKIWSVKHRGFKGWLEKSFRSVLFVIFLQIVIMFTVISQHLLFGLEAATSNVVVWPLWFLIDFATMSVVVLMAYKLLPWRSPSWGACLRGSLLVSTLFIVFKLVISSYVAVTPFPGLFGAAGILIGLLIWVYAMASLMYFGAAVAFVVDKKK